MLCATDEGDDMKWHKDDKALLVRFDGDEVDDPVCLACFGDECRLIAPVNSLLSATDWLIEQTPGGTVFEVSERHLRPIYDGHKPCTWAGVQAVTGWSPIKVLVGTGCDPVGTVVADGQ